MSIEKGKPQVTGLCHVGLYAKNPAAQAQFYQEVMGMQLVGSSGEANPHPIGQTAFLSSRPDEESHQIMFCDSPQAGHIAFKVGTLADLRAFYQQIVAQGLSINGSANHGVSLAFYFLDPEDNKIEIYWPTGLNYGQPYAHSIDLTLSEKELRQNVAELAAQVGVVWP